MRQTENYKLNLLDGADKLSPKPLNENMEKIEEALDGAAEALATEVAAVMTAMGSGGSTARIAFGGWTGDGTSGRTLTFAFKPVLVVAVGDGGRFCTTMVRGADGSQYNNQTVDVQWGEKSVTISGAADSTRLNTSGGRYCYVAIGV